MSAHDVAVDGALALAAVSGLVGIFGAERWWRIAPSREFWLALRASQVLAFAYALLAGVLYISNHKASSSLFYLYALLPIAIGFVAEQLRIVAADHVLTSRDLDEAAQVADLPADEQQSIVMSILRREMGVMALAALVVCFLALRAAGTY
jgi:hypothetical protein